MTRRWHGRDQGQPAEPVGDRDVVGIRGECTRSTVATRDGLALDRQRNPGCDIDGAHRNSVLALFDGGRPNAEPDVAAGGEELLGPVSHQLLLRVDVVLTSVAERRVVEDERLAVRPELARPDSRAAREDRLREAVPLQQLDRAMLDHSGERHAPTRERVCQSPRVDRTRHPALNIGT